MLFSQCLNDKRMSFLCELGLLYKQIYFQNSYFVIVHLKKNRFNRKGQLKIQPLKILRNHFKIILNLPNLPFIGIFLVIL